MIEGRGGGKLRASRGARCRVAWPGWPGRRGWRGQGRGGGRGPGSVKSARAHEAGAREGGGRRGRGAARAGGGAAHVDLDVGGLALRLAARLVEHDDRVGQAGAGPLLAVGEQHGRRAEGGAQADGLHLGGGRGGGDARVRVGAVPGMWAGAWGWGLVATSNWVQFTVRSMGRARGSGRGRGRGRSQARRTSGWM